MPAKKALSSKASYSFTQPMLYGLAVLVVLWLVVAQLAAAPQSANPDQYLGLITLVAIGIERVLEGLWTFVDLTKNSFWPLNITRFIDNFSIELTAHIEPAVNKIDEFIGKADETLKDAPEEIENYKNKLTNLKTQLIAMQKLTENAQAVDKARTSIVTTLNQLEGQYDKVGPVVAGAQTVVDDLENYIATIKGNPGRKLVCVFFGAYVGLIAAWIFNLDVFLATTGVAAPSMVYLGGWRVAFTGILVGLGAGPTHELIRAIQEFKNSHKAAAA